MKKNQFGHPILSDKMHRDVFGPGINPPTLPNHVLVERLAYLKKFEVPHPSDVPVSQYLCREELELPKLLGNSIFEHFENMGKRVSQNLLKMAKKFVHVVEPEFPKHLNNLNSGWNKWNSETDRWYQVSYVQEKICVFDTETFVKRGNYPIIGTAMSKEAYYIWLAPEYLDPSLSYSPRMIPFGDICELAIGQNVGFDSSRTEEAHSFDRPVTRWLDTRSMHNVTHGMTSEQRKLWGEGFPYGKWCCPADLVSLYNFYCGGGLGKEDKEARNIFVEAETMQEIVDSGDKSLWYALKDCKYTKEIFDKVLPEYLTTNPSIVAFSGMLIMGNCVLPVAENWHEWLEETEVLYEKTMEEIRTIFGSMADEIYKLWVDGELDPDEDPWLSQLNWEADYSLKKKVTKKYEVYSAETGEVRGFFTVEHGEKVDEGLVRKYKDTSKLLKSGAGKVKSKKVGEVEEQVPKSVYYSIPQWYRPRVKDGIPMSISTKAMISHLFLRLKWKGYPLYYDKTLKWGYHDERGAFHQIPHKNGAGNNVGSVLSSDYLSMMEDGVLSTDNDQAMEILNKSISCAYWTSARERVKSERVEMIPNPLNNGELWPVIAPSISAHNTITSRSGQQLWYTVPGPNGQKIGSEIKTRVQAPPGYKIIGGDIDSQEANIFGIFADSVLGVSGSTPMGFILMAGNKEDETDVHFTLAKLAGIKRKPAKTINYACQYGAGKKTIMKTLRKFNPTLSDLEAGTMTDKILAVKKGERSGKYFRNGMDSEGFNFMTDQLEDEWPTTKFLNTRMPEGILPVNDVWKMNHTSAQNWLIQCSGANFLACMQTAMEYLVNLYDLDAKFMISLHDELFYLAPEPQAKKVAVLIQIAHLWTWALFRYQCGIYELPLRNAYMSAVYIGNCWTKELGSNVTPSNMIDDQEGVEVTMNDLIPVAKEMLNERVLAMA